MLEITLILVVLVAVLLVRAYRSTYGYWIGKGIPYLSFWEYMRHVYEHFNKPLYNVVLENYRKHGRLYGSFQGFVPTLVVGDPELLRDVYVKDFNSFVDRTEPGASGNPIWDKMILVNTGEEWKTTRNVLSPAFTSSKLRAMLPKTTHVAAELCRRLLEEGKKNDGVEVVKLYNNFATDIMAALVFSLDLNSEQNPDHPLVKCCNGLFTTTGGWKVIMLFHMPRIFKHLPIEFPQTNGTEFVKNLCRHMIKGRLAQRQQKFDDALQLCLDNETQNRMLDDTDIPESMIEDISAVCMLFFVAGSDTVTTALNYVTYRLALHSEYQEQVRQEIEKALEKGDVTYDVLKSMTLLEAVINETLRLHPPDATLFRVCTQETTLSGIRVKPGMAIEIPVTGMHQDPEFFPEPDSFKPERFLPENKDSLTPYALHIFGHGPRGCIGMRMAIVQMKAILACLLRVVRFEICSETQVPIKYAVGSLLPQPVTPIKVKVVPRTS